MTTLLRFGIDPRMYEAIGHIKHIIIPIQNRRTSRGAGRILELWVSTVTFYEGVGYGMVSGPAMTSFKLLTHSLQRFEHSQIPTLGSTLKWQNWLYERTSGGGTSRCRS